MKLRPKYVALGFVLTLSALAYVYAATTDQIWQAVYDAVNGALRINQVKP